MDKKVEKIFLLLAHRTTESLEVTINYLASFPNNTILLHVDKKSNVSEFQHLSNKNVFIIDNRVSVTWGDFSVVEATINLIVKSLEFNYDYSFLISGDDLPVMSDVGFNKFLTDNWGADFIHIQDERDDLCNPIQLVGYNYRSFHYRKKKSTLEKIKSKLFSYSKNVFFKNNEAITTLSKKNFTLLKGSQWFTLRKSTIEKIVLYINSHPEIVNCFRRSYCPDEIFFNSLAKHLVVDEFYANKYKLNDCLRYIDWKSGPDYPKELTINDLMNIATDEYFFARKISHSISRDQLMNYVEKL